MSKTQAALLAEFSGYPLCVSVTFEAIIPNFSAPSASLREKDVLGGFASLRETVF